MPRSDYINTQLQLHNYQRILFGEDERNCPGPCSTNDQIEWLREELHKQRTLEQIAQQDQQLRGRSSGNLYHNDNKKAGAKHAHTKESQTRHEIKADDTFFEAHDDDDDYDDDGEILAAIHTDGMNDQLGIGNSEHHLEDLYDTDSLGSIPMALIDDCRRRKVEEHMSDVDTPSGRTDSPSR